jgi:hypothetical protein
MKNKAIKITYTDSIDPSCPDFSEIVWAPSIDAAVDIFETQVIDEGESWVVVDARNLTTVGDPVTKV